MEQGTDMTMEPDLNAKLLAEMGPGELIRFRFRGRMVLGMVAGCDFLQIPSGMVIIVLEDLPDRPGTAGGFVPMVEFLMTETALSYGTKHIVINTPCGASRTGGRRSVQYERRTAYRRRRTGDAEPLGQGRQQ